MDDFSRYLATRQPLRPLTTVFIACDTGSTSVFTGIAALPFSRCFPRVGGENSTAKRAGLSGDERHTTIHGWKIAAPGEILFPSPP